MRQAPSKEIIKQNQTRLITVTEDYTLRHSFFSHSSPPPPERWREKERESIRHRKLALIVHSSRTTSLSQAGALQLLNKRILS